MKHPFSVSLLFLTTLSLCAAVPPLSSTEDNSGTHFTLQWHRAADGPLATASGLLVMERSESSIVERLLVESPDERLIVLTYWLDAARGVEHWEFTDERTSWSMQYEIHYGFHGSTLNSYFAEGNSLHLSGNAPSLRLQAKTSAGLDVSWVAEAEFENTAFAFADVVVNAETEEALGSQIPDELIDTVFFLEKALEPEPGAPSEDSDGFPGIAAVFKRPVLFLAEVLRLEKDARSRTPDRGWRLLATLEKDLLGPDDLEFVSRFQTVENADPLSDLRFGKD